MIAPVTTVKFVAKGNNLASSAVWYRQLPGNQHRLNNIHFTFDPDEKKYDWLVVYDDLPPLGTARFSNRIEKINCPRQNTLFITAEPSTIKNYGTAFLNQFGIVLSSQEPWATPGSNVIHSQPGLRWYYGVPWKWQLEPQRLISLDQLIDRTPMDKNKIISTVCSSKKMRNTAHFDRYTFTQRLANDLGSLDLFGHGVRLIDDKADALDHYKYHIAIENHICPHHFTEKLSDAFLGYTLPFYSGCPNIDDYFPSQSIIKININNYEESLNIIKNTINNDEYNKRLPHIIEARNRVLKKYNLFYVIEKIINDHGEIKNSNGTLGSDYYIYSRRAMRGKNISNRIKFMMEAYKIRRLNRKYKNTV